MKLFLVNNHKKPKHARSSHLSSSTSIMATTATLNPTNLLFVNGGNQESKITTGSGFFRFDGASAAAAVTLRNIGNASAADHAVNKSQLDSSVTAATAARSTLSSTLTTAFQAADATLQSNIDAEAAARVSSDNTLQSNVDACLVSAKAYTDSELATETAARIAADNAATTARGTMSTNISGNTSAIAAESTARAAAVSAAQTAAAADATSKVAAEATLRANGDAATLVDAKAYTDAEVASATTACNAYADGKVDALASGVSWKDACVVIAQQALPACVYDGSALTLTASATGLLTIDSVSPSVGDRVLVNGQASKKQNGIYEVSTNAANATFVLTRPADANTSAALGSAAVFITQGSQSESAFILVGDGVVLNTEVYDTFVGSQIVRWNRADGRVEIESEQYGRREYSRGR